MQPDNGPQMGIKFAELTEVIFAFLGRHKHAYQNHIKYCFIFWLTIFLLMQFFLALVSASFASELWQPIREQTLEVKQGSVLDLSSLFPVQAAGAKGVVQLDAAGHLHIANEAQPQRFLCASMVPSAPNGGLPAKDEADRWVEQLSRTGYNLVRLHFIDAILMTGRKGDFDYDPVAFDRLHYLMAKLKSAGIYWIVDGMTSDNGAYGNVQPHRWVNRYRLKERLYYDASALEHWKRLVTSVWGRVNPYIGLAPMNDPAMLGMILVNEGSLAFLATLEGRYPKELNAPFGAWLASRYQVDAALRKAWGAEATVRDRLGVSAEVPDELRGTGKRARDFAAFIAEHETTLYHAMEAHVRSRGFKGMVTNFNNWNFNQADAVRDAVGWVDMHAYQSSPSRFTDPGSKLAQTSIFENAGYYGRALSNARHWGKPFTVTEYGQPFWNQWRHESAAWIPALAAFQDWDAICQFAELPVLLEYAKSGPPRRLAMYPFGIGADPITRGGERLAALLFRRGDVTPSRAHVTLSFDPARVFNDGKAWGQVPEALSRLALVAGSGLAQTSSTTPKNSSTEIVFSLDDHSGGLLGKVENAALKKGILLNQNPVEKLKSSGLLLSNNQTDLSKGLFETDTGQMVFDASRKKLTIATERTVAFTLRSGSVQAGGIELKDLSSPATVAVSAVDDHAIGQSRRLLVWVLTDAINTGMEFEGGDRATLKKLGSFPPMLREVTGQLAIKHDSPATLKVWAVDQAGRRVAQVHSNAESGYLRFAVDNVVPGYGPVTYFEVAEK